MHKIHMTIRVEQFGQMGEKTGWKYLLIPAEQAQKLHPQNRKSFRVKGYLDKVAVEKLALIPMGDGHYLIPLNAGLRRQLGAGLGSEVVAQLTKDETDLEIHPALLDCLNMEPAAAKTFFAMPPSHQRYYSKWIAAAKTEATEAKRIGNCLKAMEQKLTFGEATKLP